MEIKIVLAMKLFVPVARGPAEIGCRIPMAPFGKVALPMVGIRGCGVAEVLRGVKPVAVGPIGVRPDMGARGASPAAGRDIGVNMERFVPGIMDMLGTGTNPKAQIYTHTVIVKKQAKYHHYSTQ